MATMIPDKPIDISKESLEDVMFEALERLPEEYYVFHSFKLLNCDDGFYHESEADFIIFHEKKGLLCLEAKAGKNIQRKADGYWYYGSGIRMSHKGPYSQASGNMWKIMNYISSLGLDEILARCKVLSGVWFPSIKVSDLYKVNLPSDADKRVTLTAEALDNPQQYIDAIFDIGVGQGTETNLSKRNVEQLIEKVLCPSFDLIPTITFKNDQRRKVFNRLLEEQAKLLNYLVDQPYGVINGAAGTGKTMIALQMARNYGNMGERVLFLCYNKRLNSFLRETNQDCENIDFYTIDALACKMCKSGTPDYGELCSELEDCYYEERFPYRHIVIDEGQDFGQENIEECKVIELLERNVLDNEHQPGTFYIFYDRLQLVQGKTLPSYIENSDCKLTLYRNCRNTMNIAKTSLRPMGEVKRKVMVKEDSIDGDLPLMTFIEEQNTIKAVNDLIDKFVVAGNKNIVILTCRTEAKSAIADSIVDEFYKYKNKKYLFTTCRKFKGLEADAIIIIDVDKTIFEEETSRLFYVGTSRARFNLGIVSTMKDDECIEILKSREIRVGKNVKKSMTTALNAINFVATE